MDNQLIAFITPEIINHFVKYEGKVSHFYLDTRGFATIGIGYMVPSAEAALNLRFFDKKCNHTATVSQILDEYKTVRSAPYGQQYTAGFYAAWTKLYLTDADIFRLFENTLNGKINVFRLKVPEWYKFPEKAKLVVSDMMYNLGVTGLLLKFPRFMGHMRNFNYAAAAKESARLGISPERNEWVRSTLLSLTDQT